MSITIKSGFGRGGKVIRWDGSDWRAVASVAENTWVGDGDDTQTVELSEFQQYAIGTYYTIGHTRVWHWELVNFAQSYLDGPAPQCGWRTDDLGGSATRVERVTTMGDWLLATAGRNFLPDTDVIDGAKPHPTVSGLRLARLPYEWGDQPAEHWAVYRDGQIISQAAGCGDRTPEPVVTPTGWRFESLAEMMEAANREAEAARAAMFARGQQGPWAEVGQHLASCYRRRLNPLPTLRKEHGGKWEFVANGGFVRPVSGAIAWQGDGWTVIHTPAA